VLLTGFLGSGKTTLVNRLLQDPGLADTAVAINEFGETPLDQHLIAGEADSTAVLANGCLCCNLGGDLEDAVMRIFSRREAGELPRFKRLIIEPSGLSDPAPIAQALLRNPVMSRAFRLEAIIAAVDVLFAESQLTRHAETRKQISIADQVVLTKTDLADPEQARRVRGLVAALNPVAPIRRSQDVAADPRLVLPGAFLDPAGSRPEPTARRAAMLAEPVLSAAEHGPSVAAVTLTADRALDWRALDAWLRDLRIRRAEAILRLKGLVNVSGARGPLVLHGVHHVLHPPIEMEAWPDGDHRTRIVLITQGAPTAEISDDWAAALPRLAAAHAPYGDEGSGLWDKGFPSPTRPSPVSANGPVPT
jgi:G3E family GTPase